MTVKQKKIDSRKFQLLLPWWFYAILAPVAFAVMHWVLPEAFAGNPFLVMPVVALRLLEWPAFIFFALIALVAFASDWKKKGRKPPDIDTPEADHDSPVSSSVKNISAIAEVKAQSDKTVARGWNIDVLRNVESRRFDMLCARYFELVGLTFKGVRRGADGGIYLKLFKNSQDKALAIVQCRAGNSMPVGVAEVRDLSQIMIRETVARGVFIAAGNYTSDALAFANLNQIQLLDGTGFLERVQKLPEEQQSKLLRYALKAESKAALCPSCGSRMEKRIGRRGTFWACATYSECRQVLAAVGAG